MAIPAVDKLTYAELLKLEERIKSAIAARKAEDAKVTKDELRAMAAKAGFNLDELFGRKRGPKPGQMARVKYRNPKDPSQIWTGRGRKPNWLVDALKKGGKLDSFSV
jgi:DNA-binding protein H-NS